MTIMARVQLSDALLARCPDEVRSRPESLDGPTSADALLHLGKGRPVRDPGQVAEDQIGHRDSLPGCADLQGLVQVVWHVADLDHLHVFHMFTCATHALKGRTRRSGVRQRARVRPPAMARARSAATWAPRGRRRALAAPGAAGPLPAPACAGAEPAPGSRAVSAAGASAARPAPGRW